MINREDMLALTRRMTVKRTSITRIAGSYMDEEGDTVYTDYSVELKKVYKGKLKEKLEEKENIHIIDLGGCIKASEYFAKQDDPKIKKIKEDIQLYEEEKETIKNNDTDWMNIFKKKEKINELNRLLIDELIEDIVVSEDGNIKVIFKYEDKYFEALDFINKQKYDIILSS